MVVRKISKAELRRIYNLWANEEIDSIILIEAVNDYLNGN